MRQLRNTAAAMIAAAVSFFALGVATAARLERVNQTGISAPIDSNGDSSAVAVSSDGRFSLFYSEAGNLVAGDSNGLGDLFVHDQQSGAVERVNVGSPGAEATAATDLQADISDDGRYVVFQSHAAGLVAQDTYGQPQIYLRDRVAATTTLLSAGPSGTAAASGAFEPRISGDGRYVLMRSSSRLSASMAHGWNDIYRLGRQSGQIERLSLGPAGEQLEAGSVFCGVSRDASVVAFHSGSSQTLCERPGIVLRNRNTGVSVCADLGWQQYEMIGSGYSCGLSADGDRLAFTSTYYADGAYHEALFLWRREDQSVEKLTAAPDDRLEWPRMCADGSYVVFSSRATNLLPDDGNRAFRDVYIAVDLDDVLFADGFEPQP